MSKIFGSVFGGGKPQISTGPTPYQQTPQFVQDAIQQLFSQGTSAAAQPNQAFDNLYTQGLQGPAGMGFMSGAQNAFGQGSNFLNQISPQVGMANGYLNAASGNIAQGTNPITAGMIGDQATQLMSPYTSNVLDTLKGAFNDNLNSQLSMNNSNSTLAGAFGSDRAALDRGQTALANNRAFGEQAGGLLNNAYQTAANQALTNLTGERDRFLQGAGLNINQASGALGGANAYAQAANSAANLGNSNLAGSNQNYANNTERMKQLAIAAGVPQGELGILQSLLSSFAPYAGGGASASNTQPGLLQQLGLSGGANSQYSGGLGSLVTIGKGLGGVLGF